MVTLADRRKYKIQWAKTAVPSLRRKYSFDNGNIIRTILDYPNFFEYLTEEIIDGQKYYLAIANNYLQRGLRYNYKIVLSINDETQEVTIIAVLVNDDKRKLSDQLKEECKPL